MDAVDLDAAGPIVLDRVAAVGREKDRRSEIEGATV